MKKHLFLLVSAIVVMGFSRLHAETIKMVTGAPKDSPAYQRAVVVMNAIGERMGATITVTTLPQIRATLELKKGDSYQGDIARGVDIEKEIPDLIKIMEPITTVPYFVIATSSDIKVNGWQSMKPYDVVYRRGNLMIERNLSGVAKSIYPLDTVEQALQFILAKRADVFMDTPLVFMHLMKSPRFKDKGLQILKPPIHVINFYTYFNRKYPDIAKRYLDALVSIKNDKNYLRQLLEKNKQNREGQSADPDSPASHLPPPISP